MILCQHLSCPLQIQIVRGGFAPGQVKNPLDVRTAYADFRRTGRHAAQPFNLLGTLLLGLLVEGRILHAGFQFIHIRGLGVAKFGLNGLDLFTQVVILLVLLNLLLNASLYLLFYAHKLRFPCQNAAQFLQASLQVQCFQHLHAIVHAYQHIGSNHVRQTFRCFQLTNGIDGFLGDPLTCGGEFLKVVQCGAHQSVHFHIVFRNMLIRVDGNIRSHVRISLLGRLHRAPAIALHQYTKGISRQAHDLLHGGNGSDRGEVIPIRVFHVCIPLGH